MFLGNSQPLGACPQNNQNCQAPTEASLMRTMEYQQAVVVFPKLLKGDLLSMISFLFILHHQLYTILQKIRRF